MTWRRVRAHSVIDCIFRSLLWWRLAWSRYLSSLCGELSQYNMRRVGSLYMRPDWHLEPIAVKGESVTGDGLNWSFSVSSPNHERRLIEGPFPVPKKWTRISSLPLCSTVSISGRILERNVWASPGRSMGTKAVDIRLLGRILSLLRERGLALKLSDSHSLRWAYKKTMLPHKTDLLKKRDWIPRGKNAIMPSLLNYLHHLRLLATTRI